MRSYTAAMLVCIFCRGNQPQLQSCSRCLDKQEGSSESSINQLQMLHWVAGGKWFPTKVTQDGPTSCCYISTDNSGMTFWKNQWILKPFDYTATPKHSTKTAIKCPTLQAISKHFKLLYKWVYFPELPFLINYRAVPPVRTVGYAPVTYPEMRSTRWRYHYGCLEYRLECPLAWFWGITYWVALLKKTCRPEDGRGWDVTWVAKTLPEAVCVLHTHYQT